MNRWLLTLLTMSGLWIGYRVYARFITPLTRPQGPPPLAAIAAAPIPVHPEDFETPDQLLQAADWTQHVKFRVNHSDTAYFYFNEYEAKSTHVELKPFAMVWRRPQDSSQQPYVIRCDGARLTFQRPFKVGGTESPGRLLGAVLDGRFEITGPNGLKIVGAHCTFSEESHQLYSDHEIEFQYIPNEEGGLRIVQGTADKLQIDFAPTTFSAHGRDMPHVGQPELLTLRRDVDLLFRYFDGGEVVSTKVTSAGPFKFDFTHNLATFEDRVQVYRPTKNRDNSNGQDSLSASWLGLQFEEDPAKSLAGAADPIAAFDDSESPLANLRFRRLRAIGKSAAEPVILTSTRSDFTGRMHDLQYDAIERILEMQDVEKDVVLKNGEVELRTPVLRLLHDENQQVSFVEAPGQGRLDYERLVKESAPQKFHALWNRRLTLQPDPSSQLTVVVLEGDAQVVQPDGMSIRCERLTLDVDSRRVETELAAPSQPPAQTSESPAPQLPLRHALAEGRVHMKGEQFEVQTDRLDVAFESAALPKGPTGQSPKTAGRAAPKPPRQLIETSLSLQAVRREVPRRAHRSPPAESTGALASVPDGAPESRGLGEPRTKPPGRLAPGERWDVTADSIVATVFQDPDTKKSELREVVGEGSVVVQQIPPPRLPLVGAGRTTEEEPLSVTGDRLQMVNQGALDQVLHLKGAPAHLRRAGVHIEGDELFFDREINTAKVIGKGMMQSPVRGGLSGEPQAAPSRLDVHWLREMRFDGLVAHYVEGVRTRLDDSVMRCDEMTVTLNRRVDFSADQPETEGLAIQNVLCERGVDFDYVQWIGGQELAGRAEGRAGEFELRYDTGDFQARGGGHLRVWRKDDQRRVDVEPSQSRANEPAAAESLPWQYTYVKFHDRITGNMHKKVATLYDRVSVIHAPVQQVMQVFSRDDLSRDSESSRNAIWLGCDELTLSLHPAPGKDRENIQVLAVGKLARVELEGRLFQANADTLTYDESTNLFTFRGLGNNTVSVAHQERPGAPYNETGGQMIQFNPALRSGSLQGSRGAFGSR